MDRRQRSGPGRFAEPRCTYSQLPGPGTQGTGPTTREASCRCRSGQLMTAGSYSRRMLSPRTTTCTRNCPADPAARITGSDGPRLQVRAQQVGTRTGRGGVEISAPPASPQQGKAPKEGFLMGHQRLAYLVCGPPDCGKTVLEAAGAVIAAPDREGMAFSECFPGHVRGHTARSFTLAGEGPKPPVGARSLIIKKMAKPLAVQAERLSGTPPTKELLCAYPQQ
ncbi:hypothetical protein ABIB49_003062 [Arthrobacter sp. UYCu512]